MQRLFTRLLYLSGRSNTKQLAASTSINASINKKTHGETLRRGCSQSFDDIRRNTIFHMHHNTCITIKRREKRRKTEGDEREGRKERQRVWPKVEKREKRKEKKGRKREGQ